MNFILESISFPLEQSIIESPSVLRTDVSFPKELSLENCAKVHGKL
jgi:hypothetical protein